MQVYNTSISTNLSDFNAFYLVLISCYFHFSHLMFLFSSGIERAVKGESFPVAMSLKVLEQQKLDSLNLHVLMCLEKYSKLYDISVLLKKKIQI